MPPATNRLPAPLALLSGALVFLILSRVRHALPVMSGVSFFWRTIDISLLYVVALAPAVVAAALHPSRWLLIGVAAAYLSEIIRQLLSVVVPLTSADPSASLGMPVSSVLVEIAVSAIPNAVLGLAGAALGVALAMGLYRRQ
jgi:hypothetical protein